MPQIALGHNVEVDATALVMKFGGADQGGEADLLGQPRMNGVREPKISACHHPGIYEPMFTRTYRDQRQETSGCCVMKNTLIRATLGSLEYFIL